MLGPEKRPDQDRVDAPQLGNEPPAKAALPDLREGLRIPRRYTEPGVHPYDEIEWELRDAVITNERGEVAFEQRNVEVPKSWSQLATNVVAQKYFRGQLGTPERETSVRQLIDRVVKTAARWGREGGAFASEADAEAFEAELTHLLVHQMVSFNSPVWFNCGVEEHPQVSACFINSVEDTMGSILDLAKTEGMLFKFGSGTGSNLSTLRSSREKLAGGGTASGPVSFMKGYDAFAGVIKSGGKTRRAAKMVILNCDHPDIEEFINCKADEEKKAWALIDAGYSGEFNVPGGAYDSVFFQNANHSVRVTDEFMRAVLGDRDWQTRAVTSGKPVETVKAKKLMREMAEAAWVCGDPGIQYDTTINAWHTCPNTAPINASNPCSEYMFLDDSACNLASLNLMKFRRPDGEFDVESFRHAVEVTITAMEIWVDNASYPTPAIEKNSHEYRPLGLGYANLGALLMSRGLPYDDDSGRQYAAAVTALMCGESYCQSARIAAKSGPFLGFTRNREPFLQVMRKHQSPADGIDGEVVPTDLLSAARGVWADAVTLGTEYGYKNAQATVLAPTGTIAFMMDCDTTGIEPDLALVKYKKLVGGGLFKIVNNTVPLALKKLGYERDAIQQIVDHVDEQGTIEGCELLDEAHLPVFDCSFKPQNGKRSIHHMGHIKMMAAVQPFLSGAISKTVNMPADSTVEDIEEAYIEAWRLGLKAIAIYRDGCKRTQPLSTGAAGSAAAATGLATGTQPARRKLEDTRESITHKFSVAGHEGYITVGLYPDTRQPGEIFITLGKAGSTLAGFADAFATAISFSLQHGVELRFLVDKFTHVRFEPSGFTGNPDIPIAKSIVDYVFRWLAQQFLPEDQRPGGGLSVNGGSGEFEADADAKARLAEQERAVFVAQADAPPCHECGEIMVRNGACYACVNCGATSGCS
ncbi:MAG: vitamin B12-dependent ribonucleotide reductase [Acidobacteria bacterium]|nr:vitamin B12-dependent ribonucleotide reductase [Acidobacteriota bacterium]NIM62672.1 vitamin B12-dependent ribonucleotide reductase [Acidobacteriota bacterium]NIO59912.1 vitamin B12-dependent ribonucleotide reductase [Acidobacteriota bacterium]NIQ86086.1 vitamin B12-dependent ribonucleotide reductase [Acidobacteriota bacterium]NIT11602.1 vitamin B12-dependent ribonucleotide reductase [Acidobacteriota bacterium]